MPEIAVGGWLFQIKQFEEKRIDKVYALRQPEALEEAEDVTEDEG